MIVGHVNARLEAILPLQVEDSSGCLHAVNPVIDTGFTSDLTLPAARISALGLPWLIAIMAQLANGSLQTTDVYDAILWWDGHPIQVKIQAVETDPLLGTGLLAGHELKAQFVPGGDVALVPIP